jgi:outer membrane biosynthesis protein TonB
MTDWTKWESLVINGAFPLRRFLRRSDHSVVFLTEHEAQNLPVAAIKLIPAEPSLDELQLSQWRTVATFSHPHLIRLLDAGRCQLGGHPFLFVVMEYAEQTLAQILPHRALTADEVWDMLPPTLDALAFLHGKNWVHGRLKPPNFLVVNDQLKLSSDTIRPAINGSISTADDVRALGLTIVEALTQRPPERPGAEPEAASWPATLPPDFVDIVRRALSRNPVDRPTIIELQAQINRAPALPSSVAAMPQPEAREPPAEAPAEAEAPPRAPAETEAPARVPAEAEAEAEAPAPETPAEESPKRHWFVVAIAGALVLLAIVWAGLHRFQSQPKSEQPASGASETATQQAASSAPVPPQNPKMSRSSPPAVLHQEIPDISAGARASIRGRIKVAVRVTVDRSGNVIGETLENRGSSQYFARLATEAAKKWRFSSADDQGTRVWLLHFEFTRDGATAHAALAQ